MNIYEVLRLHRLWLSGAPGGKRADLRGADLRGVQLWGANLWGVCLQGADLEGSALERTNLQGADLRNSFLKGANLQDAYMRNADLENADLENANLRGVKLWGCHGNGKEIKNIEGLRWPITYTKTILQIGCKGYLIAEWREFSDELINEMDEDALEFWKEYKTKIFNHINWHPADNETILCTTGCIK